jgi:hypothetical protein
MKVFNGNKFLESKAVQVTLSNGKEFTVREIPTEVMDEISTMGDNAKSEDLKTSIAKACGVDAGLFSNIGIVELRGLLDFLFESLFTLKSPKETI